MAGCNNRNSFQRSGVSQQTRLLKALLPSSVKADERLPADLILFAKEYGRYLNYYNDAAIQINNDVMQPDGDWVALMKMDVSVSLATLAKLDTAECFAYIDFLVQKIRETSSADIAALKKYYRALYDFIYSLTHWLDEEWQYMPADFGFTEYLKNILQSRLNELYWRLNEYYTQSDTEGLIDHNAFTVFENAPLDLTAVEYLSIIELSPEWQYTAPAFTIPVEGNTDAEKIKYISQHAIFKGTIELFLKTISNITTKAAEWLDKTLESFPTHTPGYALYLTFIKLFRYAQDHLNEYTKRHLDFYYKDILQLKNQPAQPDTAHLIIELAKQTEAHLLTKNTVFKAGKDADGMERYYAITDDVVLNKGQIKSIKSVYAKAEAGNFKIYASPVANSADGKGADLTTTDKSWKPFGVVSDENFAGTGFSIAHSLLYLKEGTRMLIVAVQCANATSLFGKDMRQWFSARYTAEKAWEPAEIFWGFALGNVIFFGVSIPVDKPAVVPYNEKIHTAGYTTALPVMEFTINTAAVQHNPHVWMKDIQVTNIFLYALAWGVKDISIQNELSVLDAAKPFEIFGPQPHIGSSFIIGSKEIFLKNNKAAVSATVNIEWDKTDKLKYPLDNYYDYFVNKKVRIKYLQNGVWVNAAADQTILDHTHQTVDGITYHVQINESLQLPVPQFANDFDFSSNEPYTVTSGNGFVKIEFIGPSDFGHSDYAKRLVYATLNTPSNIPPEPYTPTIKSISIDYFASASFAVNNSSGTINDTEGHFYHLLPFGHAEQHASLQGLGSVQTLLPEFTNEGELYVGIENFKANQSLQVLFQLSEGSANPLKDRQDIAWYFLAANNQWQLFDDKSFADASNDLTVSGIIKYGFPNTAIDINTAFNEQLFWIKGVVQHDTDACCNIIQLHTQAIKALFADYLQKGNYYKVVLPAETISKLLISDSAVKKIQQPYSSFGGRIKEPDDIFYIRISERLRHKNRGISMWDYERLVLQNFTEIYKVKCLNHTRITLSGGIESDNETAPGYVVVVPIPDLRNKNAVDPLKPMTSIGTLINIEEYLKLHISPFVRLQVKNARFEEIQLDFRVKFNNDDGAFYHDLLITEIEQYLSPWAYDAGADINFGGRIYKSVLLDFVEERSYVDFVTCFKMFQYVDGVRSADIDEAVATSARSIFVSFGGTTTNPKHIIDYVNYDCNCS